MGSKYTTQTASGYNSSPPPDDGSQSASNLITWSGIKSKLADPPKDLADSINTALVAALDYSVRQITTSDSTVAGDHMRTVEIAPTVSSAITVSLGDAATMTTNYVVRIKNSSTINQTIGRVTSGDTIDGTASNLTIPPKSSVIFTANSTPDGYLTVAKNGPFLDTDALVAGSSDGSKKVRLEVDGLTTGTTRVVTVPDHDITIGDAAVLGTEQAASSVATIDFTGIPSWAKKITVMFVGVSTSGTSNIIIQIGDAGGVETSGYLGAASSVATTVTSTAFTTGFGATETTSAATVLHGSIQLTLEDAANFTWVASGVLSKSNSAETAITAGSKSTSAALDRVRITTVGGTDTFDAGAINIIYE